MGVLFALTTACLACGGAAANADAKRGGTGDSTPASNVAWTPATLRKFLFATENSLEWFAARAAQGKPNVVLGECYGEQAVKTIKVSDAVAELQQRFAGKALRCYLATYLGCRIGEWIGMAGEARYLDKPIAFNGSKVTFVSQTAGRVVADVTEADPQDVLDDGNLNPETVDGKHEYGDSLRSRYTLERDSRGIWHITDRQPNWEGWECRER
jgi:hypothetical protein